VWQIYSDDPYYDQTLLDYRVNQGPRSRWVTGEVYIDSGLEDALNVDRDSFNRFHPEFRAVQTFVHEVLRTQIFPDVYRKMERRSERKKKSKEKDRKDHLEAVVSDVFESTVTVRVAGDQEAAEKKPRARINESGDRVIVTLPPAESLRTKKPQQQSAAAILAIFEVALREQTDELRREVFTKLLLDLLKGW